MQDHKEIKISIKEANVDKEIVPLVNFLNNFEGVYTTQCCQGDSKKSKRSGLPYVSFLGTDYETVIALFQSFEDAPCSISILDSPGAMKYSYAILFNNKEDLKKMIKWIRNEHGSYFDAPK